MFQDVTDGTNNDRKISAHSSAREAFFIEFGRVVRQKFPNIVLMLTGGFRTRAGMQAAIDENACDLVGLGRVSVVDPHWPARNLRQDVSDEQAQMWLDTVQPNWIMRSIPVKPIGAGVENDFYASQIRRMGRGLNPVAPGQSVDAKL
jgi:2,4-dienoyl-CoA reductase-like NADH-dependent reductase (Old Yellow Enzyme family)